MMKRKRMAIKQRLLLVSTLEKQLHMILRRLRFPDKPSCITLAIILRSVEFRTIKRVSLFHKDDNKFLKISKPNPKITVWTSRKSTRSRTNKWAISNDLELNCGKSPINLFPDIFVFVVVNNHTDEDRPERQDDARWRFLIYLKCHLSMNISFRDQHTNEHMVFNWSSKEASLEFGYCNYDEITNASKSSLTLCVWAKP
jgi:hypothetical protein